MCICRESFHCDHCKWQKKCCFQRVHLLVQKWGYRPSLCPLLTKLLPFKFWLTNPFLSSLSLCSPSLYNEQWHLYFLYFVWHHSWFYFQIDGGKYFTVNSASCQLLPQNLQLHFVISQDGNRPIRYQIPIRKIPRFIPKFGAHRSTTVRPAHIFPISEFPRSKTSQTIIFLSDVCFALLIRLIDDHELLHI